MAKATGNRFAKKSPLGKKNRASRLRPGKTSLGVKKSYTVGLAPETNAEISALIEKAYAGEVDLAQPAVKKAVLTTINALDTGVLRVASKIEGQWVTQGWVKQAILLYFRMQKVEVMRAGCLTFIDKIATKRWTGKEGVRVVPHGVVRHGAFVQPGAIIMPSYVNIGAYVGSGSMVDTWATVGSCAQIGANVHLSGGVGIGGVLEPIQASPVIVEDNAFIGSRCIVVEGVVIEEGAVLGAGTTLTASTKIIDVTKEKAEVITGRVPANAVVIPGTTPKQFPAGVFQVPCALIIGQRKPSTNLKTSLTDALREFNVSV